MRCRPLAMAIALGLCVVSARAEMRTWTSTAGSTVEAEFVRSDGRTVALRSGDGQMMQIGLTALSPDDRAYVAERSAPSTPNVAAPLPPPVRPGGRNENILTDEQLAELKSELPLRDGERVTFTGSFGPKRLDAREQRRLRPDSPIAFRVMADLRHATLGSGGGWSSRRLPGRATFYVLDSAGEVVLSRSEPIASLCPT